MNNFCPPHPHPWGILWLFISFFQFAAIEPSLTTSANGSSAPAVSLCPSGSVKWSPWREDSGKVPFFRVPIGPLHNMQSQFALCWALSSSLCYFGNSPYSGQGPGLMALKFQGIVKLFKHFFWRKPSSLDRGKGKCHNEGRIVGVNLSFPFILF